jgi:tetratricopeptide (TPR) repeat protein
MTSTITTLVRSFRLPPAAAPLLALCALTCGLSAQAQPKPAPATETAAPADGGKEALKSAAALAEKARGVRGAERKEILERAARAFEEVAVAHARTPAIAAEASFEAAELWRRCENLSAAEGLYAKANELEPARWAERALLEIAHVQRRLKRFDDAIATYEKCAKVKGGSARAHEARLGIGQCHEAKGQLAEAVAAYRAAVEADTTPTRKIDSLDELAKTLVQQGDLDGAAAAIGQAESLEASGDTGVDAERLRRAIEQMGARKALQRAHDKKTNAARSAEEVEKRKQ